MRRLVAALLLLPALAAPVRGQDAPQVPLRGGSHPDHGRLVFDWPSRVAYTAEQEGGRILLRFDAPGRIDLAGVVRPPRNVLGLAQEDGAVVIRVAPEVRLRHFRLGNRVVVDLLDGTPAGAAASASAVAPPRPPRERPDAPSARRPAAVAAGEARGRPVPAVSMPARQGDAAATVPAPAAAQAVVGRDQGGATSARPSDAVRPGGAPPGPSSSSTVRPSEGSPNARPPDTPPSHAAAPSAVSPHAAPLRGAPPNAAPPHADQARAAPPNPAASRAPTAAPALAPSGALPVRPLRDAPAIAVPAGAGTGLALFRRGEVLHAVFDSPLALDLAPLRGHPVFAGLEALPAGEGTLLRLRLAAPARLLARRDGAAWVLEAARGTPAESAGLRVVAEPGPPAHLVLQGGLEGAAAGSVVALADPETGEPLLVATLRRAGPGVALGRRLPEFEILPSMMGAAVLARSDRVVMRPAEDRILVLAAGGGSLALGAAGGREPSAQALAMSRLLDLPVAPVPALMERLRVQLLSINDTPPLGRGRRRRDAAETLLALGLPQEAQAMAGLGLREDPQAREDARLILVQGAAALLAGRAAEARGIADARLPELDEVALWRALLAAAEGDAGAAPALAAGAPLLLAYPEALRARLLPLALEAMVAGGEAASAARLAAETGDLPGLDLVRGMLAEAEGRGAEALELYAAVVGGRDRRQRAVALRRATELRLARGEIDSGGAAAALEQALFAWRGGAEEVAARRRIAALRIEAGQGPEAFAMLDETSRLFPDQAAELRPELAAAFAAALETAPPLVAASLFDAHPGLLPHGERGDAAVLLLADRLAALDLPGRAAALLDGAASRAGPSGRAEIGARLATLRLEMGDAAAALAALDSTAAQELPEALATRRALLRARLLARRGNRSEAAALLAGLGPAGAEAR
ncbi:hypothetical protein GXW74_09730, partial [Roseomonas eburnea]|nr:hypothetical protein [Neoroseomonas eburnea]